MTIVVGYVPKHEGRAALRAALQEADLRGESLYVLNNSRGDAYVDPSHAPADDLAEARRFLGESGIRYELEQHVSGRTAPRRWSRRRRPRTARSPPGWRHPETAEPSTGGMKLRAVRRFCRVAGH